MALLKTTPERFADEIQNLYATRLNRLLSLPKTAARARDPHLQAALSAHLDETRQQVGRLRKISGLTGIDTAREACAPIEDQIERTAAIRPTADCAAANDLGIAAAAGGVAQSEAHRYEMALTLARELGHREAERLLRESLWEVNGATRSFRELAQQFLSRWQEPSAALEEHGMVGWTGAPSGST